LGSVVGCAGHDGDDSAPNVGVVQQASTGPLAASPNPCQYVPGTPGVHGCSTTLTATTNPGTYGIWVQGGSGPYVQVDCFTGTSRTFVTGPWIVPGQSAQVVGQSEDGDFVYLVGPNNERVCAVPSSSDFGELGGNCENLPQFTPPPPPPTATSTPLPPTATETAAADSGISGTVWEDADGGKDIDGGEPRFNGLTVELRAGGCGAGVAQTTTTNASGQYTFSGLQAGTYCVRVLLPPGNWAATVPEFPPNQAPTRQVTVGASEILVGANFGLQQVVQ
jgi:hypothetical protein